MDFNGAVRGLRTVVPFHVFHTERVENERREIIRKEWLEPFGGACEVVSTAVVSSLT